MKPIIAIVGRPNVGKSTLFNRIMGKKDALVDDFPGVTRDRHYGETAWNDIPFTIVDTGGFTGDDEDGFGDKIRFQVRLAMEDADVIILVLDGKGGISPFDREIIALLRSVSLPVFYVVNKIDSEEKEIQLYDFYQLGIERFYSLSAEHGYGVPDFLDDLTAVLPQSAQDEPDDAISVAVVGRPNVGKSSLINKILGEERLVVSDTPGTTRDAIDTMCRVRGRNYRLIDTAGIRRKARVSEKIEKFSVLKALKSLERCDVALIVLDAEEGVTDQDIRVAGYAYERGCGCVFILNKWDRIEKDNRTVRRFTEQIRTAAKFLGFAPILAVSALTGHRVSRIFGQIDAVYGQYSMRLDTGPLNKILEQALSRTEPSLHKGKRLKFYYVTQVGVKPPTFVFFVNYPEGVHFSYQRYLINQIRETTGLDSTPIRVMFRLRTGRIEFARKKQRPRDNKRR
ncbi:MAG: ribosome biogenesis GTPase Der [Thermodesulfobacteriota bacterium]